MNRMQAAALALVAAVGLAAAARAQEAGPQASGQVAGGVVVEITIQDPLTLVSGGGSSSNGVLLGQPSGRLFLGSKSGRLVAGVGLELARIGYSNSSGGSDNSSSQTQLTVVPGLRYSLASSADQRAEALAVVNVGIGHVFTSSSNQGTTGDTGSNYRLVYEVGPALRYWIHPQFAIGANAGLRGDHQFYSVGSSTSSIGVTSVFTGLDVMGVF